MFHVNTFSIMFLHSWSLENSRIVDGELEPWHLTLLFPLVKVSDVEQDKLAVAPNRVFLTLIVYYLSLWRFFTFSKFHVNIVLALEFLACILRERCF